MDVEKLKKQLDNDERFLNEIRNKAGQQMRRLKAEERELRQLLIHSAVIPTAVAVEHNQDVTDIHIDEEQWINQTPLELNGSEHNQRSSHHSVVNPGNEGGVQSSSVLPAELHDQLAARTVVQSILQEELGPDWMDDGRN